MILKYKKLKHIVISYKNFYRHKQEKKANKQ